MKSSLRKGLFLLCTFVLLMGLAAGNVVAAQPREGELIQEVAFAKTDLMFSDYENFDVVTLARYGTTGQIGKPYLTRLCLRSRPNQLAQRSHQSYSTILIIMP